MKEISFLICYGIIWVAVSIAICVGIYYTKDPKCLLGFLIPTMMRVTINEKKDNNKNWDLKTYWEIRRTNTIYIIYKNKSIQLRVLYFYGLIFAEITISLIDE